jgi:hypothetical protein
MKANCKACTDHYGDAGQCDEGKPVNSPHRHPAPTTNPTPWHFAGHVGRPVVPYIIDAAGHEVPWNEDTAQRFAEQDADTRASLSRCVAALEALVEVANGRCTSCNCPIAPEGYCGCEPSHDPVVYARRVAARAALAAVPSGKGRR